MPTDDDLDPADFDKIIGSYRLKLNGLLQPLTMYGQGDYVAQLVGELESLGIQLHLRLSGVDMPFMTSKSY